MKDSAIAIIGMAGRFPGARNVGKFWLNLKNGVESIRTFSDEELLAGGVSAEELAQPEYVKLGVVLEDLDMFDAGFFGFSPKDAAIMDPQHRIFLECAWEALEDAGHVPGASEEGSIGVYAGSGMSSYMIHNLLTNPQLVASTGLFLIRQTGNDKDVLATRVSYELNLHGPSINVQTACSTSLVAVHLACQSLLNQECDMALAGGVTVEFPHGRGYLYREGEILSRDGHCRAFDADSSGTVFSSGAGIVVLKRLEDALADRDAIRAVILGSAINNDGSRKVGYLAPSVDGQCEVIAEALGVAGVAPGDISYVETHGTGTRVGDPIEVKALTQAFRQGATGKGQCAIGSLKTNVGHMDTAAGVAGLIKTTLALEHGQIPPSLHFGKANPLIDFEKSPFQVNTQLVEWNATRGPRRAGVTSLGIGGTNAHVVLEEAPLVERHESTHPYQLIVLSAKSAAALEQACNNLHDYLREQPDVPLQDAAYTLQVGRKHFAHRRTVVASTSEEAAKLLAGGDASRVHSGQAAANAPGAVFMFSGQGSQYVNMGRELYEREAGFRTVLDECAERLIPCLDLDLRKLLYPAESDAAEAERNLSHTRFTQPALFSIEYALAQWWMAHGVAPAAMIGHSIGEYVAACVAGVFSLEEGLRLSALRGRLMGEMTPGAMLSVAAEAGALSLPAELSLAAINGPEQCVVSGDTEAIRKFASELEGRSIHCRMLHTSHAFHSAMMEPMLNDFCSHMEKVSLCAPKIPYISNVSGTWIMAAEATDPRYWTKHLRQTVRWSDGMAELFREPGRVYLEVGPGQVLTSLGRQQHGRPAVSKVLASMRHSQEQVPDAALLLKTAGRLWIAGVSLDWDALHAGDQPRRVPLPTYPFERQRYWIDGGKKFVEALESRREESWFHQRVWKKLPIEKTASLGQQRWLLFLDETGLSPEIVKQLKSRGHEVLVVAAGDTYKRRHNDSYVIRPGVRADYDEMLKDIVKRQHRPTQILHLWSITDTGACQCLDRALDLSFYSLLFLTQAWGDQDMGEVNIACVSNGLQSVSGESVMAPARATLLGPVRLIPKEFPGTLCRNIDLEWNIHDRTKAADQVIAECSVRAAESCVAYRKSERWVESFEPLKLQPRSAGVRMKEKGVYLITGGMGGIGLVLAEHLARSVHARLVLVGRTAVPPKSEWNDVLDQSIGARDVRQKIGKLREIESLGGEVLTISTDVTESKQIEIALQMARERFGNIDGVIHAAGLIEDGPMQIKARESAARVLAPKVQGTLALQEALRSSKLDFVVLFSSSSSLTPPDGQVDYAAANAFMDAFALSQSELPVTSVNWGKWGEVGLAAQEIARQLPALGRPLVQNATERVYAGTLNCEKDWLLDEHRYKNGDSLVPGTGYLQLVAAALVKDRWERGVDFEDVFFLAPLTVARNETKDLRVHLRRVVAAQETAFQFSILAKGMEWTEHATGQITRNQRAVPADQNVDEIRQRCSKKRIDFDEQHRTLQEKHFEFGRRWRNLRCLYMGEGEALAKLQLGHEFVGDIESWPMHPALLDLATGSALYLIPGYESADEDSLYLPLSYRRITLYRPLPAKFYSHICSRQENTTAGEAAIFNITLLDDAGHVLAEVDEFAMRHMSDSTSPAHRPQGLATYSERSEEFQNPGMSTAEGIKAFDEILASNVPSSVIVCRGVFTGSSPVHPAPATIPTTGAERPKGNIESALVEWWQELLGVEHVGPDDDFFDLGGHSLVGVRLFAKIRKTYQADLNLAVLFEARTVRQLAAVIRKAMGPTDAGRKSWSALVPIQPNGSRIPLFCVHAQGTSVLFYQNLSKYLGTEQPFYALQSPLVSATQTREATIEELASIYVKELQEFLPEGPYLLGGASLGGLIALEMAQQLYAVGKKPRFLILFDAIVPGSYEHVEFKGQVLRHWENFREQGSGYLLQRMVSKSEYWWSRLSDGAKSAGCSLYKLAGRSLPENLRLFQVEDAHKRALNHYTIRFYPGKITLIRAADMADSVANRKDLTLGWKDYAGGGLEIQDVPGGHNTMFEEPNVQTLAKTLKAILPS